jgi:pilus assembly protein CpaB
MRAVALRINLTEDGSKFILPGARVELLVVERDGPDKEVTKPLLEKVLVLAVDLQETRDDKPLADATITVAVTPADALKLLQATKHGEVRVELRGARQDGK